MSKCSPSQRRVLGECVSKTQVKGFCIEKGMTFDRIKKTCVKPNPKHFAADIQHEKYKSVPFVKNIDAFFDNFVKTHKVSSLGSDKHKVAFVRMRHGAPGSTFTFDIGVSGFGSTPMALYTPFVFPEHERTPSATRLGTWLGSFDDHGMPYYTKGNKVFKFDGTHSIHIPGKHNVEEISKWALRKVYDTIPTKPKRAPALVKTKAAVAAEAKQRKHVRDSKKKYERVVSRFPSREAHSMLSLQ